MDVAEGALERAAAAREHLQVVLEAAVLVPELLLGERQLVEIVLELAHRVAMDDPVLLDPERRDVGVVLARLHAARELDHRDLALTDADHVDVRVLEDVVWQRLRVMATAMPSGQDGRWV